MTINKKVIDHLLSNDGKLQEDESWYDVGVQFGITPPDEDRAKEDVGYFRKSIARSAQDIWRNYLKRKNSLQVTKETYSNGELISETFSRIPEMPEVDLSKFEIERMTTNPHGGMWLKYTKKDEVREQEERESLLEILKRELEPREYPKVESIGCEKSLLLYGADKHFGALTKEDSIYTNKYDREEMKSRIIDSSLLEIERWTELVGKLDSLHVMELGDALDGFNGKTTGGLRGSSQHTLPQQLSNNQQHDFYVEVHKELMDLIVQGEYATNLYFIATSNSNHGGDFEYGAMKHLETYLNVKYPFINTYVSDRAFNHFFYGEHCIIFGHGKDSEDMKHGMPLVLNDKTEKYIADYIRSNNLEGYAITFVTADLHQAAQTFGNNFRYKKVLSQYGSSKWCHTNFGSGAPGLSSDILIKHSPRVYTTDEFFTNKEETTTGIIFD